MNNEEGGCDQQNRKQDNDKLFSTPRIGLRSRLQHPVIMPRQFRRKLLVFDRIWLCRVPRLRKQNRSTVFRGQRESRRHLHALNFRFQCTHLTVPWMVPAIDLSCRFLKESTHLDGG